MHYLIATLVSAISFIAIISIIVFVHEFGHYIVAKWSGVKIDTFSIGFGKELFGWNDRTGTRWKISSLPLGGYVKMFGDATEASSPVEEIEHLSESDKQKTFYHKPLYKKAAIVAAGPLFNFLLTIAILTFFYLSGGVQSTEPVIGSVVKDTPAEAAGLQSNDRVLTINGDQVLLFSDIPRMIMTNLGTPVTLEIEREGKKFPVTLTPKQVKDKDALGMEFVHPVIGIMSKTIQMRNVGFLGAVKEAVRGTYHLCDMTLQVIAQVIEGKRSAKETVKGPLGMAELTGRAAEHGWQSILSLMALISANLGLVNLFPIPVLDGGHLLYYGIEAVRGKPPGKHFQEYGMRIGMALIVMLMAFAIFNDIHRWLTLAVK